MKRVITALGVVACLSASGAAHAFELGTPATEHPYRSAQNFALELRISPYYPNVDEEPGLHGTPFRDSFGDKARLYVGLELDWQTFRIPGVGTLGPGLSVGTVGMTRDATTLSGRESGDTYSLRIWPFTLDAVLRVDTFWRSLGFPLVPYAKAGLGYAIWRATNSGGTAEANGVSGKGTTLGTHFALGAAFALDVFDPGASRNMDNATGINNTYIYAEYYWLELTGIGQSHPLYVGTRTWAAGLAFEF